MTTIYRVAWRSANGDSQTRQYGNREEAALAFALSKSKTGPDHYVVKRTDGQDVGRWLFRDGEDADWDGIDPEDWATWPYELPSEKYMGLPSGSRLGGLKHP